MYGLSVSFSPVLLCMDCKWSGNRSPPCTCNAFYVKYALIRHSLHITFLFINSVLAASLLVRIHVYTPKYCQWLNTWMLRYNVCSENELDLVGGTELAVTQEHIWYNTCLLSVNPIPAQLRKPLGQCMQFQSIKPDSFSPFARQNL